MYHTALPVKLRGYAVEVTSKTRLVSSIDGVGTEIRVLKHSHIVID